MKKIILSLVFVLATGTNFINANSSNIEVTKITEKAIYVEEDNFSCLTDSYNFANGLEELSPGGSYSWSIEEWSEVFNNFFSLCRLQE
jgi:hypothetical protein